MIAYHGTATYNVHKLFNTDGLLYVTDTADHAQRYADAQATREVSTEIRHAASSAVVELETQDAIAWKRRDGNHGTLDVCEATIGSWEIVSVTAYVNSSDLKASVINLGSKQSLRRVKLYDYLREQLGDRLTIVVL